ncbi:hypothetical protein CEXT_762851 [Caerostris extrusa]|uniref:Uncharacterized protein n=1 Tax=Caerostris extrusa TaxID=172846 RepID=A0AAV4S6C1_CAEEX|nr:hypothetical protein CEXT_762851 [Caerostris extrusa]
MHPHPPTPANYLPFQPDEAGLMTDENYALQLTSMDKSAMLVTRTHFVAQGSLHYGKGPRFIEWRSSSFTRRIGCSLLSPLLEYLFLDSAYSHITIGWGGGR